MDLENCSPGMPRPAGRPAQIAFASLLGWATAARELCVRISAVLTSRDLTAAHLDWLMLAFMQFGAAYSFSRHRFAHETWIRAALIAGGWLNPVPYVMRGMGVDAFAFAGDWKQRSSAAISGASSLAITAAWIAVPFGWWP
jgi:hypothetical protein